MSSTRPRILVTVPMDHLPSAMAIFDGNTDTTYRPYPSDGDLLSCIGDYDAIVTNLSQKIGQTAIDAGLRLRVIATPSTGTDHIDVPYAESKNIQVQSLKLDYDLLKTVTATAEHAFMLMLACLRKMPFAFDSVRNGQWTRDCFRGREAQGRTLGIVGYGRLGEIISRYARAFGMQVIACDPNKKISDTWVRQVDFDTLLEEAEIITLHVHLTEKTVHMIGEREFDKMRDGVFLINTSRGKLIDENAFVRALESGKVGAAGVDVIATELDQKIATNPLVAYACSHENLIITPHIGGFTLDSQQKAFIHMAKKLVRELANGIRTL